MTGMPLLGRLAFTGVLFTLLAFSQIFWFRLTRNWFLRSLPPGRSPKFRLRLHGALFIALLIALAASMEANTPFASNYGVSSFRWWLDGLMGVYFAASFVSGLVLGAGQFVPRWLARWRSTPAPEPPARPAEPFAIAASSALPDPAGAAVSAATAPAIELLPPAPLDRLHPTLRPTRRRFLLTSAGLVAVAPFACCLYGFLGERLDFEITHVKLPLGPAGAALRGRTIAQISDIHIGPYLTARNLRHVVDMVNSLRPDLILITGDFVTFEGESQYDCVRELARLRPRTAMLGCLGNHEIYTHTQRSITRLCARHGIDILRFTGRRVALGNGFLNIAGVDFLRNHQIHRVQEIRPWMKPGEANLLMTHNPNGFDGLGDIPVQATIAGHTHGGQMRVEFLDVDLTPARLMTPYIAGMYSQGDRHLYVNRGIGTIGMPIRIGAPPEVTLFELA